MDLRIVNKLNSFVLVHVSTHLILTKTFTDNASDFYVEIRCY